MKKNRQFPPSVMPSPFGFPYFLPGMYPGGMPAPGALGNVGAAPGAAAGTPGAVTGLPGAAGGIPGAAQVPGATAAPSAVPLFPGQLTMEESYIENILRLNLGKMATIYMTFENNPEWKAKVFKGRLEAAGRDHIIISDPQTGKRYLLLMVNLDFITFDEELNYFYPFAQFPAAQPGR